MRIKFNQSLFFLITLSHIYAQEIPINFFDSKIYEILHDSGEKWQSNKLFGSLRFQDLNIFTNSKYVKADSLYSELGGELQFQNSKLAFNGFGHFIIGKYFYIYFHPRFENRKNALTYFSDAPVGLSGIGFQNEWITFQIGRGRQLLGAGNDIQLVISKNANTYDYGLLSMKLKKVRLQYFHGFLETLDDGTNRYITSRSIEWSNKKSLLVGISETIIYSGYNRSIDIGYLNPIASHLEVELNNRLNFHGDGNANAVWQVSLDWMVNKSMRISGNYLYDEFVLDPDIQLNKEHGKAYSYKMVFTPYKNKNSLINIYSSIMHIGTPTFRHGTGSNNFINKNKPLGWKYGSDGEEINFGVNYFNRRSIIASLEIANVSRGEESINKRYYEPYADYLKGKFPSGKVEKTLFYRSELQFWLKHNLSFISGIQLQENQNVGNNVSLFIGINIHIFKNDIL